MTGPIVGGFGLLFLLVSLFWIDEKEFRARLEVFQANAWPESPVT